MEKRIIIKYFLFIIVIFQISCNIKTYEKSSYEDHYTLIFNKKEKHFIEYLQYTNFKDTFCGTWENKDDTILLNIKSPDVVFSYKRDSSVEEYNKLNSDSIIFKVSEYANIYLNDNINSLQTDTTGYLKIKKNKLNNFTVNTFSDEIIYKVKDTLSDYFIVNTLPNTFDNYSILRVNPTIQFIKKKKNLIPVINDSLMYEYKFKKKFF